MNFFGLVASNPAAWVGIAALAAPLLIHLMTRRTPRRIVFPTIRFIRKAQSNFSALFRVRHWLLLAVRTLLLAALLGAFLRLTWQGGTVAAADPNARQRAIVLIVDDSMSMGLTRGGGGPMTRARQAADKVLDTLGAGDRANLITATASPVSEFDEPSGNFRQIQRALGVLKPSLERADFDAAIGEALRQLALVRDARREIYVISDFQAANWDLVDLKRVPAAVSVAFVAVGETDPRNTAVVDIRAIPTSPVVGEPVDIVCKVANYGPAGTKLPLTLTVGEEAPLERELDLDAGAVVSTTFRIRANRTGLFEVTAAIPADSLTADDTRRLALNVVDAVETLIVTDEVPGDPRASHHFLQRALDPFAGGRGGSIRCTVCKPDDLTAADLARSQVVLVCGARLMREATARLLLDGVHNGGSLIVFLQSYADRGNLDLMAKLAGETPLLPFVAESSKEWRTQGGHVVFAGADYGDPMLRPFRDGQALEQVRFGRVFMTKASDAGETLMKYDDGTLAVGRSAYGRGFMLLCNFSPAPADSDLAKRTVFVPLVQQMARTMRPRTGGWFGGLVGGPCQIATTLPASEALPELIGPSGTPLDAVIDRGQGGDALLAIYPRMRESGFYHLRSGGNVLAAVAANVDARESNLAALDEVELKRRVSEPGATALAVDASQPGALDRLVEGRPAWPGMVLAGMALLALEQLLTFVWRR